VKQFFLHIIFILIFAAGCMPVTESTTMDSVVSASESASESASDDGNSSSSGDVSEDEELEPYEIPTPDTDEYGEYPVLGRMEGSTYFSHRDVVSKQCNSSYPDWYCGEREGSMAGLTSMHTYQTLIGRSAETSHIAENMTAGVFELKPGVTYPAHNHPAREFYYVISGEAEWWADDEVQNVGAGAAMYHRPYTVHGFINTSETEPLRLFWIWWLEDEDHPDFLDIGGRFTDPDLVGSVDTVEAFAVPIPELRAEPLADAPPDDQSFVIPTPSSDEYGEYPVPGRLDGRTSFSHKDVVPKQCNSSYPDWYCGEREGSMAGETSMHTYQTLIGRDAATGHIAQNLTAGIFELKPGVVYPAHNHPSREFYYVISGESEWWADDEMVNVTDGAAMYHTPYTVHGFTNTSETEPLHLFWIWWLEDEDHRDFLDIGGRFTDPDLTQSVDTVEPHAVPIPEVRTEE